MLDFLNYIESGELNKYIYSLIALIIIDYITGIFSAIYTKEVNSKLHYKGVIKKLTIMLSVLFGAVIDIMLGTVNTFTLTMIILMASNEGISILENLAKIGVPFPKVMKDVLIQLKDKTENHEPKDYKDSELKKDIENLYEKDNNLKDEKDNNTEDKTDKKER